MALSAKLAVISKMNCDVCLIGKSDFILHLLYTPVEK